jgi:hypothetical protein
VSWVHINPLDTSPRYLFPGVDLGIQIESTAKRNTEDPPKEWHKYSGSSLSCALAAGLAALILHCALLSGEVSYGDEKWEWLTQHKGMVNAFERIKAMGHVSESKWLPVRKVFGNIASKANTSDDGKGVIREELVQQLLVGMEVKPKAELRREDDPASQPLSRQGTSKMTRAEDDW